MGNYNKGRRELSLILSTGLLDTVHNSISNNQNISRDLGAKGLRKNGKADRRKNGRNHFNNPLPQTSGNNSGFS